MEPGLEDHLEDVVDALCSGTVVPLLGAGANLCDRANGAGWVAGDNLPSGEELASYLAEKLPLPRRAVGARPPAGLPVRAVRRGDGTLFRFLHDVFTRRYLPTRLHGFLATLPARLEFATGRRRHQLIVTTNYDDALEQAFAAAGEPFDLVMYLADGEERGSSCTRTRRPGQADQAAERVPGLSRGRRTVILKIQARWTAAIRTARGQLRHHRGPLHRVPHADAT